MSEKRIEITPEFERMHWLGYGFNGEHQGMFQSSSIYATYWGLHKDRHVFVGLTGDKVAVYATENQHCYLSWWSDGEDDPSIPGISASFIQFMPKGKRENLAKQIIQIAKDEDMAKQEESLRRIRAA